MLDDRTYIYTRRGWLKYTEVHPGDITISYNEYRDCTEYDEVTEIHTTQYDGPMLAIEAMSVCHRMTPDHGIKMARNNKFVCPSADRMFFSRCVNVLSNKPFEPYSITRSIEDIEWAARLAAHFVNHKDMPEDVKDVITDISNDLHGYEAFIWIKAFYAWVIKRPYSAGFRLACYVSNHYVKDLIFDIAPRAGLGAMFKADPKSAGGIGTTWKMHVAGAGYVRTQEHSWRREHIEKEVFNLVTSNGTFLSKTRSRVSLISCETGEK